MLTKIARSLRYSGPLPTSAKIELGHVFLGQMGEGDRVKLKVALVRCTEGGTQPGGSLIAVKNTVEILRPKAVFCVGSCGALHRDKTTLGDVVVSAKLTTYVDRTVTNNGVQHRGFTTPVGRDIASVNLVFWSS